MREVVAHRANRSADGRRRRQPTHGAERVSSGTLQLRASLSFHDPGNRSYGRPSPEKRRVPRVSSGVLLATSTKRVEQGKRSSARLLGASSADPLSELLAECRSKSMRHGSRLVGAQATQGVRQEAWSVRGLETPPVAGKVLVSRCTIDRRAKPLTPLGSPGIWSQRVADFRPDSPARCPGPGGPPDTQPPPGPFAFEACVGSRRKGFERVCQRA